MRDRRAARIGFHPLVGRELMGATLTPFDDLGTGSGALGRPVWGPEELLRDLELRLGLSVTVGSDAVRAACWAARMDRFANRGHFYAASFAVDPLGTARAVLELRDALLEAGWDGRTVPDGGPRLEAIAELEALSSPLLPSGLVDRVLAVARALEGYPTPIYDQLTLAEARASWPACWGRVFRALQHAGVELSTLQVALPGAPPESDLGKIQTALAAESLGAPPVPASLRGDGSLLLLSAETSLEAASATAALVSLEDPASSVVIRGADTAALDFAFELQGLSTQGLHSASPQRATLQLLPLALELAFEPKDPQRVLELVSLPRGPFAGRVGWLLARALARSPGIGGRAWEDAKSHLLEPNAETLRRIADWFEGPGADPNTGATKPELLQVIARVRAWLVSRIPLQPEDVTSFAAIQQCDALDEALKSDRRDHLDRVAVRRLVEFTTRAGARLELTKERAGRIAHVSVPGALWVPRGTVIWWSFTHGYEPPASSPWRSGERSALEAVGVLPVKLERCWSDRAAGFRRAVRAATRRLILVTPRTVAGQNMPIHPLWDELVARAGLDELGLARITRSALELSSGAQLRSPCFPCVPCAPLAPLPLPANHAEWRVELGSAPRPPHYSASGLSALLGCPLQWAFSALAGLKSEGTSLPPLYQLSGTLGHRLIEELHARDALTLPAAELRALAERELDQLIEREGAILLRSGKAHEHDQVRRLLLDAVCTLARLLEDDGLSILGVEQKFTLPWHDAELRGCWDLLVCDSAGRRVVIDVKWGQRSYRDLLAQGRALQLAAYTYALANTESTTTTSSGRSSRPGSAYFSLSTRKLFGLATPGLTQLEVVLGPDPYETWQRIERTLPLVEAQLAQGRISATGLTTSLPLLEQLEIPEAERPRHFDVEPTKPCEHCRFDGLCGRRWEGYS